MNPFLGISITCLAVTYALLAAAYGGSRGSDTAATDRITPRVQFASQETSVVAKGTEIEKLCIASRSEECTLFMKFSQKASERFHKFTKKFVKKGVIFRVNGLVIAESLQIREPIRFKNGGRSVLTESEVEALRNTSHPVPYCRSTNQ